MLSGTLKRFKVSIKLSITALFVILLVVVSAAIISINNLNINKVLVESANKLMLQTSALVEKRLESYLSPFNYNLIITRNLIDKNIFNIDSPQLTSYFFELIKSNPNIYGIHWSNPQGDFIDIDRETQGKYAIQKISRSATPAYNKRYILDSNGEITATENLTDFSFDPRLRPWYKAAEQQKKLIWSSIYAFKIFAGKEHHLPGITAAAPVYNKKGELKGVIGIDLAINELNNFIQRLSVTPESHIYLIDHKNEIVAYHNPHLTEDIVGRILDPALITRYQLPLAASILAKDNKQGTVTSYRIANNRYLIAQQRYHISNNGYWLTIIIIPASDILSQLEQALYEGIGFAIICLLLGILAVKYISQRISRPIIQLAEEAYQITNLKLTETRPIKTIVYETSYMAEAFKAMKISLQSFQRYLPSTLVKNLITSGQLAKVSGQTKNLTFLFSDIQNFTALAEQTNSQELMFYLSEYFETMTRHIIRFNGTLDKYMGDGIMAFWGAPLDDEMHAVHACQTALAMFEDLKLLNMKWRDDGLPSISMRIGINTGEATVGNMGSEERLSYTAIGDNVNIGSRLEALNKYYGTKIIVSGATYELAKDHFQFRLLDKVTVRGKAQGITIYELLTEPLTFDLESYRTDFLQAFELYQLGKWQEAIQGFKLMISAYPTDTLAPLYLKRCEQLHQQNPGDWHGIWHSQ